jgi:hypothetical protein
MKCKKPCPIHSAKAFVFVFVFGFYICRMAGDVS